MATSDMVMEADSGFVRNIRSPGSPGRVVKDEGNDIDEYEEEHNEMIGEGLFSFDEDMVPEKETGNLNERSAVLDIFYDVHSNDSGNFDMSQTHLTFSEGGADIIARARHNENPWVDQRDTCFGQRDLRSSSVELDEDGESEPVQKIGSLAYGCSLPITIPSRGFWPPRDAVDSLERMKILDFGESHELIDKTILPQRPPKDLYSEIRAQARSIQAADDPERLFGERPSRRRYQTGKAWSTSQVTTPLQTYSESADATVTADLEE